MGNDILQKLKVFGVTGCDPNPAMPNTGTTKPWLDRSLPDEARFKSYKDHMCGVGTELRERLERASDPEFNLLEAAPETKAIIAELEWLNTGLSADDFCKEMERRRPPLEKMLDSYEHDPQTGASTFTIPAGTTDVEAMKVLNEYCRKHYPSSEGDVVHKADLEWYEKLPQKYPDQCKARDYSKAREVTIVAVVEGTKGLPRSQQERVLKRKGLVFSDPRDQAIAAVLHACKHDGADLFQDFSARGSVPGFALHNFKVDGVRVIRYDDAIDHRVVASASSSPFSKTTGSKSESKKS